MALLQDLIKQIDDQALQERIMAEVNKLSKQKNLVWFLRNICRNARRFMM